MTRTHEQPKFCISEIVACASPCKPEANTDRAEIIRAEWKEAQFGRTPNGEGTYVGSGWFYTLSHDPHYWPERTLRKLPDQQGMSWTELMDSLKKPSEVRA